MSSTTKNFLMILATVVVGFLLLRWVLHLAISLLVTLLPLAIVVGGIYLAYRRSGEKPSGAVAEPCRSRGPLIFRVLVLPGLAILAQAPKIERDAYGVPHIHASSFAQAFYEAGFAVAQDRLQQMDLSRRLARGRLAEVLGKSLVPSDKEVLQTAYTDAELKRQFDRMSPRARLAVDEYTKGVNAWIAQGSLGGPGHPQREVSPWSDLDSVAICVHLLQLFGRGGAGELRNMSALAYLRGRKSIGNRALDVLDDIEWFNDPGATPTLVASDDPQAKSHYRFYIPDRAATEAHLALLPKVGLLELLGAIRLSEREISTRVAQRLGTPFRTGSYCVVVSPSHSTTGHPLLLSGPQMGLRVPSIAHEMSIEAPGLATVGMDVPGVPGIIIGHTKRFAWGITSGVADTQDICFYSSNGTDYRIGRESRPIEHVRFDLKVQGEPDQSIDQMRTVDGPVVLNSPSAKSLFVTKSAYWMREMESYDAWVNLWTCGSAPEIEKTMDETTMNFNFFFATDRGDIGWKYLGLIPKRAAGVDPRFPTPADSAHLWRGFLSPSELPNVRNPKSGFLANWNNKPVAWWPNGDTPVWGGIFENTSLLAAIAEPRLSEQDLKAVPERIAKADETWPYFKPFLAKTSLAGFDGLLIDGSQPAANYRALLGELRKSLFLSDIGSLLNPHLFELILQPSVVLRALEGKTKFDYLAGRTADQLVTGAMKKVEASPPAPYKAGSFKTLDPTPILYSNRGTYIQIVSVMPGAVSGVDILPPGVSESGPHSNDQSSLARSWSFKAMGFK